MRRPFALPLSALALSISAACSSAPTPLPGGPPPEYEAPRPFPLAKASASAEAALAPAAPVYGSVEKLGAEVDAFMAGFGSKWGEAYAPSGVLVVAEHGKPILVRTYGKSDRAKGGAPGLATRFRIGSLTKQFTAAAVLTLADAGALSLDASVRKLVPELPDTYNDITITQLLQQTSGVPSYTDDPAMLARSTENVPESELLGWMAKRAPKFPAGSKWEYSNSNYYLLAVVAERAAKEPFEAYLTKKILSPAGMKNTSSALGGDLATGYTRNVADALEPARVVSGSVPFGAGFLVSSVDDLLAWDRALVGTSVLSDAMKKKMWTVGRDRYAMGWLVMPIEGTEVEWHNGAIDGYGSFFARAPEKDLAVVYLSNVFDFDATQVGHSVLSMALGGAPVPPPVERPMVAVDEAFAKSLTGDYVLTDAAKSDLEKKLGKPELVEAISGFTIAFESGRLTGHPVGQGTFALRRGPDGVLFNASLGAEVEPHFDAKKASKPAIGFTLKQGGLSIEYVRGKLKTKPKKPDAKADKPKGDAPKAPKADAKKPKPAK